MKKKCTILVVGKNGRLGSRLIKRMTHSRFYRQFTITSVGRNDDLVPLLADAAVIIIAVKPDDLSNVAQALKGRLSLKQLVISLVTGKSGELVSRLCGTQSVICATTSVGVEIGKGNTIGFSPYGLTPLHKRLVNQIFQNWGRVEWVISDNAVAQGVIDSGCMPGIIASDALINIESSVIGTGGETERTTRRFINAMAEVVSLYYAGQSLQKISKGVVTPNGVTDSMLTESGPAIRAAKNKAIELGYNKILALRET